MENHKSNHGEVGEALAIKMTLEKFNSTFDNNAFYQNGTELSIEELNEFGISASVPLIIDSDTKGDYEAICEYGTEIHYYAD